MRPSLSVCHVIHSGAIGGGPRVVLDLVTRVPAKHTVISSDDGPLLRDAATLGITTRRLPYAGKFSFAASIPMLVQEFRSADIVHLHGQFAGLYGSLAATMARVPSLYTAHFPSFFTDWNWRNRVRNYLAELLTCRLATVVIACSQTNREEYIKRRLVDPGRITTIYNGVSVGQPQSTPGGLRIDLNLEADGPIVLGLGRLADQKGFDVLLDAAPDVLRAISSTQFILAGDGPRRAELEGQARRLGVSARVRFTGFRRDTADLFAAAAVVAAPSRYESSGLVVLEAMIAGRPVVASDLSVLREAIDDGETGIIVPLNAERLSAALVSLLRNPDRRCAMGKLARARALQRFDATRMACDYADLYDRLAGGRP